MLAIRDQASAAQIGDLEIRQLVEQRIHDLSVEPYDPDVLGYFLVIEPSDSLEEINGQLGFPILCNRFSGIRFGDAGFTPSFEFVEEYAGCYDAVFILSDDGFGVEVFIPKAEGIDPGLLAMCASYATPATPEGPMR
jgi:hypothetical protein